MKNKELILKLNIIINKPYKSMEAINLLKEGVFAFENNKYYSALTIYYIFLEKYLRDKLIEKEKGGIDLDFDIYEKIEKEIEDGFKENKKSGLTFKEIIEKLFGENTQEYENLRRIYDDIRIPILHGLYSRLSGNLGLDKDKNITISDKNGKSSYIKLNENSAFLRGNKINSVLENESIKMSEFIIELIEYFEK